MTAPQMPVRDHASDIVGLTATARQQLQAYGARSPQEMLEVRRSRLIAAVTHHYFNPHNDTYRRTLQRHGLDWGEPHTGQHSIFGRFFARHASDTHAQQILELATMPLDQILALLPVTDKALLVTGAYDQCPAVPATEIVATPASSGTTSGVRGFTALARRGLWDYAVETTLWTLLMQGIDPTTATGYLIAHFKRNDPADQAASGTHAAFSSLTDRAPDLLHLGSTQHSVEEHVAELGRPAIWSFSSPHFYRQIAARANPEQLRRLGLQTILWGGGGQNADDYEAVMASFGLRHSIGIYAVSEMGMVATQVTDRAPYAVRADSFIVEIVDGQGRPVAPGQTGTVLLTSLWHTGTPLIRYSIGDEARCLGRSDDANGLWEDLGITPRRPHNNLTQDFVRHATFFDEVARSGGLVIGDGKVSYEDVAGMQLAMARSGTPAPVFQLAKRRASDGRDEVVIRLEAPADQASAARANAHQAVRLSNQLAYLFDDGELPPPVIEVLAPGALGGGNFKVPPIVDETKHRLHATVSVR